MKILDQAIKKEITKLIEYALSPIEGKVVRFEDSLVQRHGSKQGDEPWCNWEETLYPVLINTYSNEIRVTVSSLHLDRIEGAVWKACQDFAYSSKISNEDRQEIIKKIYSSEFLKLKNSKNTA